MVTMRSGNAVALGWLLMLVAPALFGDEPLTAQATAPRAQAAPRMDGVLDEPNWKSTPALELRDIKGQETPQTVAKLLGDDRHLYGAFDRPDTDPRATRMWRCSLTLRVMGATVISFRSTHWARERTCASLTLLKAQRIPSAAPNGTARISQLPSKCAARLTNALTPTRAGQWKRQFQGANLDAQ